jgi:hypothetical protein
MHNLRTRRCASLQQRKHRLNLHLTVYGRQVQNVQIVPIRVLQMAAAQGVIGLAKQSTAMGTVHRGNSTTQPRQACVRVSQSGALVDALLLPAQAWQRLQARGSQIEFILSTRTRTVSVCPTMREGTE